MKSANDIVEDIRGAFGQLSQRQKATLERK